jgi:sensitive to high expression protein 9, mitochondrial
MALIRSEHEHDQSVEGAKDAVTAAEQSLEEARTRLEERERAQYHEEQIWSDTIRRNSSWVTFGLMGVNIALVVVNLVALEPWRRKRMVGEIRELLRDEMESRGVDEKSLNQSNPDIPAILAEDVVTDAHMDAVSPEPVALVDSQPYQPLSRDWISSYIQHPFGDQIITIRKADLTNLAFQAAAAGIMLTGALLFIIRRR